LSSLKHDELMAQRDDLGLNCGLSAKAPEEATHHHYYKVEHGRRRLTTETYTFNKSNADDVFSNHNLTMRLKTFPIVLTGHRGRARLTIVGVRESVLS